MADDLPPGYTLDPPAAAGATDLPAGYTLDKTSQEREQELRAQYLKDQLTAGEPGYSQRLKDSATRGLMRPLGGLMRGVSGVFDPTSTFGERYRAGVGAEEDFANRAVANTPGALGVLTDIAGGVGSTGAGTAAISGGREALGKIIAQGAVEGGVEGAARNAGKDVGTAVQGAAVGAGLGAAGSAAVGGASKLIPGASGAVKGAQKELREVNQGTSPQALRDTAKPYYQMLDNAGLAYAQPQTKTLKQGLDDLVATNKYNPQANPALKGYVDQLDQLAQNPAGAKFTELHNLRSAIAEQARGPDPSTRRAAGEINAEIDKLIHTNQPAINPNNVDVKAIYPDITKTWKAASVADDVGYAAGKAERKTLSQSGVNPDEANRAAFRPLQEKVEKPGAFSPFKGNTPQQQEQRALLAKIVGGDKPQNFYRGAGEVAGSPITRGLVGAGAGFLGLSHGGIPGGLGAFGLGSAGSGAVKGMLDRAAANRGAANIDALLRNITTGSSAPLNRLPSREALAILQAKQAAQRGGAAYAGSLTGER